MQEMIYYKLEEVCRILGVTLPTLYKFMNKGDLKYDMIGSHRRITPQQIKDYTERRVK